MRRIIDFLSLVKFSHTVFALPFALVGYFSALKYGACSFSFKLLIEVLLCMIFARNAAMAFNRFLDREIDKKNARTALREIPKGIIKAQAAMVFVILNSILFMATTFFINRTVFFLSPVALMVVLGYSYTKRFTYLCHFILGLGLSLAPIGAYLAVTGKFALLPVLLSFAVLFWVSGFDILYALQDEDFDRKEKLYSIPATKGREKAMIISLIIHLLAICMLVFAGFYLFHGLFYWIGVAIFSILLIYQHLIIKPDDISHINMAFATTNGVASILFAIFAILDVIIKIK